MKFEDEEVSLAVREPRMASIMEALELLAVEGSGGVVVVDVIVL